MLGYFFIQLVAFNDGGNTGLMVLLFGLIFLIALFTIALKTMKAAAANPVRSLRTE